MWNYGILCDNVDPWWSSSSLKIWLSSHVHFEACELRQILAVRPPYFSRCSTRLVASSWASKRDVRSSAQRIQWNLLNGTYAWSLSISLIGYRQGTSLVVIFSWNNFVREAVIFKKRFANITNVVPSLQCIAWFKESKHTHRSSLANITNVVPSLQCISWFEESKHTHRSSLANITNVVPSLQCISWFKESILIQYVAN